MSAVATGVLLFFTATASVHAQVGPGSLVSPDQLLRPGERERLQPEPVPRERPDIDLPVAPVKPDEGRPRALGDAVFVKAIRIEGNTALSDAELQDVIVPYQGRNLTTADLLDLRDAVTRRYVERGYINSGAVLPDQDVIDDVVSLLIVEGRISEIVVDGLSSLSEAYVTDRIRRSVGPILRIDRLEQALQILIQTPFVETIAAELAPGSIAGEAVLKLKVRESTRVLGSVTIANDRSPAVDGEHAQFSVTLHNMIGWGDAATLTVGGTEGLTELAGAIAVPLLPDDTTWTFSAEQNTTNIVEEPLDVLDVASKSQSFEAGLERPFYRTAEQDLTVRAALAYRRSATFLLGRPFSFSPGLEDSVTRLWVARLSADWIDRRVESAMAARIVASSGLKSLGPAVAPAAASGTFLTILAQAQYVRQFEGLWRDGDAQLLARIDGQWADGPLPSIERLALGGISSVRGYRTNQFVVDQGVIASLEGRMKVFDAPLGASGDDGAVELAPYIDFGWGKNRRESAPPRRRLVGAGIGVVWNAGRRVRAELYFGRALYHVDVVDRDIQDEGIHFRLVSRIF